MLYQLSITYSDKRAMEDRRYIMAQLLGRVVSFAITSLLLLAVEINAPVHAALQNQWPNNTTEKRRVVPNAIASKAGSKIHWETNIDVAFRKSAASGRPVFWYVPRLPDTFMDRVKSIDVYMKAGPFSWPKIIGTINQSFIPLAAVPDRKSQRRFNIQRYTFVEPGFLVLTTGATAADVRVIHRTQRLTTLHIPWLEKMISGIADRLNQGKDIEPNAYQAVAPAWLTEIRQAFSQRNYSEVIRLCDEHKQQQEPAAVERDLRLAMAKFRMGQHQSASALFANVAARYPDHPLGQKAAAESQGIGPFVRGFEIHSAIPKSAMAVNASSGVDPAHPVYRPAEIRQRCVDFLLSMQDQSGGVFDSDYDFGGTDSLPNVHVAVTALTGRALLKQLQYQTDPQRREAIASAVVRAARFTADDSNLSRSDRDEIFWALAYRLELWTAIERSGQTSISADESGPIIQRCIDDLTKIQLRSGSWFHEYANSFVTATGVLSLHEASELSGNARSKSALSSAVASLSRQRHLSGAFPYDESAQSTKYPPTVPASAGRMPLCEAAIFLGGKSSVVRLQYAIESSFQNHRALDVAYKYDDHTDARNFSYGGFFFWFDMRGRKQAIDLLPESPTKTKFAQQLEAIVISKSEIDGCYVDSHEIGRCYGSAMALLCLEK